MLPPVNRSVAAEVCLPNSLMRRWLDEMRVADPSAAYHTIDPASFGAPDDIVTDIFELVALLPLREAAMAIDASQRSPFDDLRPELRHAFLADTHIRRTRSTPPQ